MKNFSFIIKDPDGIHARPAGLLVKTAGEFSSSITIKKGDKSGDAKRIFSIMSLGAKQKDELVFSIEGDDEQLAAEKLEKFCQENL